MAVFPTTSTTLLQKMAAEKSGVDESAWNRFFELYAPAMRRFIELNDPTHDSDDVVQDVCLKLVEILRAGAYDREKSHFRTFLALLIRRHLISLYRKDCARRVDAQTSLESLAVLGYEPSVPAEQPGVLDLTWARAKHEAAVEHVLTKTALSAQSRAVYLALVREGRSIADVAASFGIAENLVRQIRFRIDKRIALLEEEYCG